jgi:hypothetical protein
MAYDCRTRAELLDLFVLGRTIPHPKIAYLRLGSPEIIALFQQTDMILLLDTSIDCFSLYFFAGVSSSRRVNTNIITMASRFILDYI